MNTPMQERVLAMAGAEANLNNFLQPAETAEIIVQAWSAAAMAKYSVTPSWARPPFFE
jgi:hypothetical protein